MKENIFKILSLLSILLLLTFSILTRYNILKNKNINSSQNSNLETNTSQIQKINNYVALGDSITYGTGLENIDTESYSNLLSDFFNTTVTNHAQDGMNSSWLLYNIEQGQYVDDIKNAEVITISVGSNDLFWPFYKKLAEIFGVNITKPHDLLKSIAENFSKATITEKYDMLSKLYKTTYSEKTKQELDTAVNEYEKKWPKLISKIKEINPTAKLIVIEYYNPYSHIFLPLIGNGSLGFSAYIDSYIDSLNKTLYENAHLGYEIAYIKDSFYSSDSTNVSISVFNFNLDPHPNKNGHKIIYEKILELLNK